MNAEHLTHIHSNVTAEQVNRTYKGMAHWAGSGPLGRTCRHCAHWQGSDGERYSGHGRTLKPSTCAKYHALTGVNFKRGFIQHYAQACKHFTEEPNPPAIAKAL